MKSHYLQIAEDVLEAERKPLSPKGIIDLAKERGLLSDRLAGRTPHQTLKAKLSLQIRRSGDQSTFVRTSPGRFYLRRLLTPDLKEYEAQPLRPPTSTEKILVVPTARLDELGLFQGIATSGSRIVGPVYDGSITSYMSRPLAEQNNEHKQILTYIMVTRRDQILSFRRGTYNRVEDILRGRFCIGFGGHVNINDVDIFDRHRMGIFRCAARELSEELALPDADLKRVERMEGFQLRGILNDDSSEIGRRHIAFVMEYRVLDSPAWNEPKRGEKSINELRWLEVGNLDIGMHDFEYWSQLCLMDFFPYSREGLTSFYVRRKSRLKPPNLIAVVGEIGSGKTRTVQVLKDRHGYFVINSGKVVADILGIPPVPITSREEFQRQARDFISSEQGPQALAQRLFQMVTASGSDRIVVDGLRQLATLEALRKLVRPRHVGLIYVQTPPHVAFNFYDARSSTDHSKILSIRQFLALREDAVELEVGKMIGQADAVLYNWSGVDQYLETMKKLMDEVGR